MYICIVYKHNTILYIGRNFRFGGSAEGRGILKMSDSVFARLGENNISHISVLNVLHVLWHILVAAVPLCCVNFVIKINTSTPPILLPWDVQTNRPKDNIQRTAVNILQPTTSDGGQDRVTSQGAQRLLLHSPIKTPSLD